MNPKLLLPLHRARERFVLAALRALPGPPARVLDVGCGEGHLHGAIRPLCGALDACDLSAADLWHAALAAPGEPTPRYHVADAARLPWEDGTFDVVLGLELIEHVADARAVLSELARVLRPGGTLILTCPSRHFPFTYDPLHRLAGRRLAGIGAYAFGHDYLPTEAEVRAWLAEVALHDVRCARLTGALAAVTEAYWAGAIQRVGKANAGNRGTARRSGLRLGQRVPPGLAWVDRLIDLDERMSAGRPSSVGLGFVATRA